MVFQKPNPFPAMTIEENVLSGLEVLPDQAAGGGKTALVEEMLTKAGLWNEVKDRLGELGGALSGGQQQRLCIARALAVRPRVLLMDEPCSALDPTSTNRIEETIRDIADEVTVVIVTHNMQQAQRVSTDAAPSSWPRRASRAGSSSSARPRSCSPTPTTRGRPTTSTGGSDDPTPALAICALVALTLGVVAGLFGAIIDAAGPARRRSRSSTRRDRASPASPYRSGRASTTS